MTPTALKRWAAGLVDEAQASVEKQYDTVGVVGKRQAPSAAPASSSSSIAIDQTSVSARSLRQRKKARCSRFVIAQVLCVTIAAGLLVGIIAGHGVLSLFTSPSTVKRELESSRIARVLRSKHATENGAHDVVGANAANEATRQQRRYSYNDAGDAALVALPGSGLRGRPTAAEIRAAAVSDLFDEPP